MKPDIGPTLFLMQAHPSVNASQGLARPSITQVTNQSRRHLRNVLRLHGWSGSMSPGPTRRGNLGVCGLLALILRHQINGDRLDSCRCSRTLPLSRPVADFRLSTSCPQPGITMGSALHPLAFSRHTRNMP
jgi:hypothetical protein